MSVNSPEISITLIDKEGTTDSLPRLTKREIADVLLDRIKGKVGAKANSYASVRLIATRDRRLIH